MFDLKLRQVILWQYENAEKLIGLVDILQEGYDRQNKDFWKNWYDDVFNFNTATDFGLLIWSKILKVKLSVSFEPQLDKIGFGYGLNRKNYFKPANYGSRRGMNVGLTNDQKRTIIKARYFSLTSRPTLDNINAFLKENFWVGSNRVFVTDPMDMSIITYTFFYQPDGGLQFLLDNMEILPRPAGVGTGYNIITKKSFGYGLYRQNYSAPSNYRFIKRS
jgi:hypothetical protein